MTDGSEKSVVAADTAEIVEVGADEDALPLWKATQAVRHAELRLAAQASNLTAMEGRATSILGWSVAGTTVLGAASLQGEYRAAAAVAAAMLFLSAILMVVAVWPRRWGLAGELPIFFTSTSLESELAIQEQILEDYRVTIDENERRLATFGQFLAISWMFFVAAPVTAFGVAVAIAFS
jgi:hypothetical protein